MKFERIVLDTNVFIAFRRTFITDIVFEHGKTIYSCQKQVDEYIRVSGYKKIKNDFTIKPNIDILLDLTIIMEVEERYDKGPTEDRYLIDLCYTVKADYLVTLDHGLLALKHIGKIQIIDPDYFKSIL